jgi:GNAT superfamily N-acetyltransferase
VGRPADETGPELSLEIRPLDAAEVEVVADVLGLARLDQGDGTYQVAWADGEPVGHAYLSSPGGGVAPHIQDVWVRQEWRGRGIAGRLIAAVEVAARALGSDVLRLEVSAEDESVQRLYARLGYVDSGLPPRRVQGTVVIRTGPIEVDDRLLTWEKRLSPEASPSARW